MAIIKFTKRPFWIIGDDDSITDKANEDEKMLKNDLTILNYDLYDQALEKNCLEVFLKSISENKVVILIKNI